MSARRRGRISTRILLISAVAWMVLLVGPANTMPHAHRPATDLGASLASSQINKGHSASPMSHAHHAVTDAQTPQDSLSGAPAMNPFLALMAGWALMLVAMMSPTLIAPICHIIERSFKRRRARSVTLFVIGYAAIWMATGVVLITTMLLLNLVLPQSYWPAVGVGILAIVWQCSPIKQRCLNRSHNHRALAAFGMAADLDAVRFGITHGVWCVGSCWVLMLLPMLLQQWHFVAMAVVTFVMISERLEQPRPLSWRLRFPGKLMRIVVAQTRIRLQSLPSSH